MACYHPLRGFRSFDGSLTQSPRKAIDDNLITVACGQCIGCRLERSRQWAVRCIHEAQTHSDNCFLTLTYDNLHLDRFLSLNLAHFQKFMKRLRKKYGKGIRYFHCGEYGEKFRRPHYHACIFGFDFPDKYLWMERNGFKYYRSPSLEKLWRHGNCLISDVTFESAAYVARYITKKINGPQKQTHYEYFNEDTGEVFDRKPEYITMSRRPGIGNAWFKKYTTDVYPCDSVVVRGVECRPPKYYDSQYEILNPEKFEELKFSRVDSAKKFADNNTRDRLRVRESITKKRLKELKRGYESDT